MDAIGRRPIQAHRGALPPPLIRCLDALAVVYVGVLVYATHHPKPANLVGTNPPNDKFLHLAAYATLGGVVAAALAARGGWRTRSGVALFASLTLFAAVDEATQPLFGRWADQVDWAFDEIGLSLGIAAVTALVMGWHRGGPTSTAPGNVEPSGQ
jgi:hypothetical protein